MAESPDEAKELRLVNNVEMKIALADTDAKLQKLLNLYLPPLLLKLGSPHASVRNKVVAVCSHVNTRIKPSNLLLPVGPLLDQFKDPDVGGKHPLVRNFDLMYVTTGIERMPVAERLELLPKLIKNISKTENDHHQRTLFNVFLRLLQHFVPPERASNEDAELRAKLGLQDAPVDAVWLAEWFSKLMLLNLNAFARDGDKSCPGLSAGDVEFLTMGKKETFTPFSVLADIKLAVLRFVASGAFVDEERYMVALIASTDTNSAVGDPAEDSLKRVMPSVSLEEGQVVQNLYGLLLGRSGVPPAKPTLQTKIIGLLSKTQKAADPSRKAEIEKILDLGLETSYSKLRQGAFSFLIWVSRMANEDLAHALAPSVVEKLRYWLLSDVATSDELKGNAYETLVLLASRCVRIVLEPQLDIIRFLFRQLRDDRGAVAASIEGALGVLLTRLSKENFDPAVKAALEDMLLEVIVEEKRGVGQAVKWAGRLLGFSSVVGRWVGVLAVGMGGTIAEEGGKALHPYYYRLMNPEASLSGARVVDESMDIDGLEDKFAFPKFSELVSYFFSAQHVLPRSYSTSENLIDGRLPAKSFAAALALVKRIAIWEAQGTQQVEIKVDEDWDRSVDMIISTDELARGRVENLLKESLYSDPSIVRTLLGVAWAGMIDAGEGVDGARNTWNDLTVLAPQSVLDHYTPQLSAVQKLLKAPKEETRRVAAFAVGLLGSHSTVPDTVLGQLLATLVAGIGEKRSGSFIAIGFLLSKLKLRGRLSATDSEMLKSAVEAIVTTVSESRDSVLIEAAIETLGELAVFGIIKEDMIDVGKVQKALIEKAGRGDEKAVQTLGYLTLIYPEDSSETESIMQELTKLGENGGVEMSFVAGEALANAAAGWGSSAVRRGRAIAGEQWTLGRRNGVKNLLVQFLKRATEPGGGGKRRTTVVGLLSVFEFCSETPALQEKLGEAQQAFRTFLTDRDDFIQETAARGLTTVYSLSDEKTQKDLVQSLVSSFTGETKQKITVSRDTQLFEPGQLPTGDGASVGSYGDIMSLAAELGDPSLVYKFMSLARNNSVWASRAAFGRFGLGKILSSSVEVKDNEKLWPVLYRYRFDPTTGVRQSMESIWQALGGGSETVERWWRSILEECLKSALRGNEWRVREASAGAMADLLGGRKVLQYKEYLRDIWVVAFKVLDDVKESVRVAAMKLCKALTTGMVRAVEADIGEKETEEILTILMEFLMGRQGLEAGAEEAQMFALDTLLQIVKKGRSKLRPWIPEIVSKMLVALADMEPEAVNYLIMNADKYNTTGDHIDRIRLNSIRSSPIMATIEDTLDNLDGPSMAELIPQLIRSIRSSLSLPSKVGCSRVVVSLVMRHPVLFRPYADEVAKVLVGAVKDRSDAVSQSYAAAVGYLSRIATDKGILSIIEWAQKTYWEGEERDRRASGLVTEAVYKHATDRANALAVDILPFVFIAKNDTDESVSEGFSKTWADNTGGSGAIKLYLKEIVQLATANISSARWATRQTCALALAGAATSIGHDTDALQLEILWPAVVTAASGRSWKGKGKVVEALVALAANTKRHVNQDAKKLKEIEQIVIREAKRNNLPYRGPALGALAAEFEELDLFEKYYEIIESVVSPDDDDMDIDGEDGKSAKEVKTATLVNGFKALSQALRPNLVQDEGSLIRQITQFLGLIDNHTAGSALEVKSSTIESISTLLNRLAVAKLEPQERSWTTLLRRIWLRVLEHSTDRNYEAGRIKAVAAFEPYTSVLKRHKQCGGDSEECVELVNTVRKDIETLVREEKSPMVLRVLNPASSSILGML